MQQSTRNQQYPFTWRGAIAANVQACTDKMYLYLVPPDRALTIEQLYCHLRMTFDSGVASGDRVVASLGVGNELPMDASNNPSIYKKFTLNQAADGSRKVDIRVNLTPLLTKTHVTRRSFSEDPNTGDSTYVVLKFPDSLRENNNVGTINLWKLDGLFTTKGIH